MAAPIVVGTIVTVSQMMVWVVGSTRAHDPSIGLVVAIDEGDITGLLYHLRCLRGCCETWVPSDQCRALTFLIEVAV